MANAKTSLSAGENRHKNSVSRKVVYAIAFTLMAIYALLVLYFFVYGILISLKLNQSTFVKDTINGKIFCWPDPFGLENFQNYWRTFLTEAQLGVDSPYTTWETLVGTTFWGLIWNSIWRTASSSFLTWFTTAIVCYVLVHYRNKFTNFIYVLGLLIATLPLYGTQAATYRLYDALGLINSPTITFVSITLYGGYFFYMYAFWKSISHSYAEAASIDGANHYQILFKVMLPQVLPSIISLFIMQFIAAWNDYESTAAYMNEYPNLAYGAYAMREAGRGDTPTMFAGVMLSLLPILLLFVAFQNTIMEKVYLGGLKE